MDQRSGNGHLAKELADLKVDYGKAQRENARLARDNRELSESLARARAELARRPPVSIKGLSTFGKCQAKEDLRPEDGQERKKVRAAAKSAQEAAGPRAADDFPNSLLV